MTDAIVSDGLYFPLTTVNVSTGGANPPCPDPPEPVLLIPQITCGTESLVPRITGANFAKDCPPPTTGTVIEGLANLGVYTWAFSGEQVVSNAGSPAFSWPALPAYGGSLATLIAELDGDHSVNQSTEGLLISGIGINRQNGGILANEDTDVGFWQTRLLAGTENFPDPTSSALHVRLIVKDFFQGPLGILEATYAELSDGVAGLFNVIGIPVGTVGNLTPELQFNYGTGVGSFQGQFALPPAIVGQWMLIDLYVEPTAPTIFIGINGVDYSTAFVGPGGPLTAVFAANPAVALLNAVTNTATTPAIGVTLLFAGFRVGASAFLDFARHQVDATLLGVA